MARQKTNEIADSTADSNTVGRQELSKRIAQKTKLTKKQSSDVLEAVLETITEALRNGEEVRLVNFGSFKVRTSAARRGVSPRGDHQEIHVPAKDRVRFSPGKELAQSVLKKEK